MKTWGFLALSTGIVALDQLTKYLVRAYLGLGEAFPEGWAVRFRHVTNTGGAFGLFGGQAFLLTFLAIVGILALVFLWQRSPSSPLMRAALGLQLGGGIGNLIDRLRQGYVTDFIDFRVWPVFNVADSAITIGTFCLALSLVLSGGVLRKGGKA